MVKLATAYLLGGVLASVGAAQAQSAASFAAVVTYSTGASSAPYDLALADVNGDGKLDLVTANYASSTISVLLGTGTGSFGPVTIFSTGANSLPYDIAVADVNGDSKPDLLTANLGTSTAGVLLGTGTGSFGAVTAFSTASRGGGNNPDGIGVADVNGDGKLDLVTADYSSGTVSVLLGTGTGSFGPATAFSAGANSFPNTITVADVNGDGKPDLLTSNSGSTSNSAGVLLGTGTGSFGPVTTFSAGANSGPAAIAVADVNGDGKPDLLTANLVSSSAGVLLGTGTGSFGPVTTFSAGVSSAPYGIAVADVNGDGKPDLLTANHNSNTAGILLGTGTGSFGAVTTFSTGASSYPFAIAVADVNGDGRPDLLTPNQGSSTAGVLLNATTPLATRATLPGTTATLAPNPAGAATTLAAAGLPATVAWVQATLLDATGRFVRRQALAASQGLAQAELTTAGLMPGLYVVQLQALDGAGAAVGALPAQRLEIE